MEPTRDTLLGGDLVLWQPSRRAGYRFNLDPVLLSGFVPPAAHVLDLGAGCGVLGLLLLATGQAERVTAVELQPALAQLAMRNGVENDLRDRYDVLVGDLRDVELPAVDGAVFNPPYFRAHEGRAPPDPGRGVARHELHGTLADFVHRAFTRVRSGGPVCAIVRSERDAELRRLVAQAGAYPARSRCVLSRAGEAARHVLIEARSMAPATETQEPPLVVHAGTGRAYSEEVRRLLRA